MTTLFILNDPPYGTERSYNAPGADEIAAVAAGLPGASRGSASAATS